MKEISFFELILEFIVPFKFYMLKYKLKYDKIYIYLMVIKVFYHVAYLILELNTNILEHQFIILKSNTNFARALELSS